MDSYADSQQMVDALVSRLSDQVGEETQIVETHSAWVLLSGHFAYKIKKPVNFGFLDFSSLVRRRQFCELEVELNRRYAPDIYLDMVPICGKHEHPVLDADAKLPVIDYAVKMQRFSCKALLSHIADQRKLTQFHVEKFAATLAQAHLGAKVASYKSNFGGAERVVRWMMENFSVILPNLSRQEQPDMRDFSRKVRSLCKSLYGEFKARKAHSHIRECHGDLHLNNVVWLRRQPVFFDCIEFNDELRWIDTISEIAFVFMDLVFRRYADLAYHFLSVYLQETGDYEGLKVLPFYLCYRALVRAKVDLLSRAQVVDHSEEDRLSDLFVQHVGIAKRTLERKSPFLLIMHGVSGSGKTTLARDLALRFQLIHVRSDVERKRMAGLPLNEKSNSAIDEGIYSQDFNARVYEQLHKTAKTILEAGYSAVLDATYLSAGERDQAFALAKDLGVKFAIVHCHADPSALEARVTAREEADTDASEANVAVLARQLAQDHRLREIEKAYSIAVDTMQEDAPEIVVEAIKTLLGECHCSSDRS